MQCCTIDTGEQLLASSYCRAWLLTFSLFACRKFPQLEEERSTTDELLTAFETKSAKLKRIYKTRQATMALNKKAVVASIEVQILCAQHALCKQTRMLGVGMI